MSNARKLADNLPTEGQLSGRNIIINGAQTIDQRNNGSAITKSGSHQYATDRFICRLVTSSSSTFQRVADAPSGYYNSMKVTIGTGATPSSGDGGNYFSYIAEGQDTSHFNWGSSNAKTVTLSFWVKCSIAGAFSIMIGNNALDRGYPASYTINSANTWEYKTITVAGDTSGTWPTDNTGGVRIIWDWGNGSNFKGSANAWASGDLRGGATGGTALCATSGATWQITGCQLEVGSQSTPFEHEPVGVTLSKCQRYYYAHIVADNATQYVGQGDMYTNTQLDLDVVFPVPMRASPTLVQTSGTSYWRGYGASSSILVNNNWNLWLLNSEKTIASHYVQAASSSTAGNAMRIINNETLAALAYDAEL
tara:strand:- start:142 stop:1236 length:1095 start_codon:yes stop_codon:yes gene_type:complete